MKRVILLSLFFFLSASWAAADRHAYPRTVLEDRPVGYWRFEKTRTRAKVENLGSQETALDGTCVDAYVARCWPVWRSRVEVAGWHLVGRTFVSASIYSAATSIRCTQIRGISR